MELCLALGSSSFDQGVAIGSVLGIPISLWVGYKLARKLGLFD